MLIDVVFVVDLNDGLGNYTPSVRHYYAVIRRAEKLVELVMVDHLSVSSHAAGTGTILPRV
jgi:hypothetical protein